MALAAIFQHSPLVLLTRKNSGIETPRDLIGKKVMLLNPRTDAYFHAMLRNAGIKAQEVDIVTSSFDIEDLITGKVSAFNSYITTKQPPAQAGGFQ